MCGEVSGGWWSVAPGGVEAQDGRDTVYAWQMCGVRAFARCGGSRGAGVADQAGDAGQAQHAGPRRAGW